MGKKLIVLLLLLSPSIWADTTTGWATYYTRESCKHEGTGGKDILMANGQPLNDNGMTCALWVTNANGRPMRPDGRLIQVRNAGNGKTVTVKWTDNGPGKKARARNVVVDLTPAAFRSLGGQLRDGKIRVETKRRE
ncbi:MAG: septal ring lytic transglycosylase RlpA family protein [Dehalococcoidia bacterium]|jgi:rare lipoprotein A|nr:septal ring lytic transglycosylase RlpA family protein [Dehalococcoidia bacterium]